MSIKPKMALPIFGYYMQQVYADKSLDYKYMFKDFEIPKDSANNNPPPVDPSELDEKKIIGF